MEIAFPGVFGVAGTPFWSTQGFQRVVWQRDKKWKGFSKGWEAMIWRTLRLSAMTRKGRLLIVERAAKIGQKLMGCEWEEGTLAVALKRA